MEELASRTEFQHDKVVLSGFGKVNEIHHVGVVQLPHNLHFLQDIGSLDRHKTSVTVDLNAAGAQVRGKHEDGRKRTSTVFGAFFSKSGCMTP